MKGLFQREPPEEEVEIQEFSNFLFDFLLNHIEVHSPNRSLSLTVMISSVHSLFLHNFTCMGPTKFTENSGEKKERVGFSIEMKQKIIEKYKKKTHAVNGSGKRIFVYYRHASETKEIF